MEWLPISDELKKSSLTLSPLLALQDDADLYNVMCLQHLGEIEFTNNYVRNANKENAFNKHISYFKLASERQPDLLMTPEYSCPWDVIKNIIDNKIFPKEGKLWQIGCESITREEFKQFTQANKANWIYDERVFQEKTEKNFLDPVLLIFNAVDSAKNVKNIIAVQFKRVPMGGNNFERDNLICGKCGYFFENPKKAIRLITIICSEAIELHLDREFEDINNSPLLILHPQLNLNPFSETFRVYRDGAYRNVYGDTIEVICLNWASKFKLNGNATSDYGGSCLYIKNVKLDLCDQRINHNHKKGFYFTISGHRTGNYYFNYAEGIYYFKSTKCSQRGAAHVKSGKTGPEMVSYYLWNSQKKEWTSVEADDGFISLCKELDQNLDPLTSDQITALDRERLLSLSVGAIGGKKNSKSENWYSPDILDSFSVAENETINRATFIQHPCPDSKENRKKNILKFSHLRNKLILQKPFPDSLKDLESDCEIRYPIKNHKDEVEYHLNLSSKCGMRHATGIYMGTHLTKGMAQEKFDRVSNLLLEDTEKRRIAVWYHDEDMNIQHYSKGRPPIDQDVPSNSQNFTRDD